MMSGALRRTLAEIRVAHSLVARQRFHTSAFRYKDVVVVEGETLSEEKSSLKVYTKTGDKGRSALYTGERRSKSDPIFEALGTTDELSSTIGFSQSCLKDPKIFALDQKLVKIQCLLQDVGSNIATPVNSKSKTKIANTRFDVDGLFVKELEEWIDEMSKELVLHKYFVLPSGGMAASSLHVARTICRRAERCVIPLMDEIDPNVLKYLNRLSDFLFTAARYVAKIEGQKESVYLRYSN
ncbi:hypothetical protein BB560_003665 [Smittium megazygosporum]|uniref:Corrinoid adenosyltransferase MMAB n=1 Tax=Smittium megazygosporum TaxID=133381 RepID=A0A2T9ZBB2_9FUNG|nr:hypothetical protein BB560_003665 [Smittium megazygosporum]